MKVLHPPSATGGGRGADVADPGTPVELLHTSALTVAPPPVGGAASASWPVRWGDG
jgi:hypothetical protein